MSILATLITGVFAPTVELAKHAYTSDKQRLEESRKLLAIILEHDSKHIQAQASVITAEAKGEGWLQRNWRPITMLTFLGLVVCDCFGLLAFRLSSEAWTLLTVGLGGYVFSRGGEKIAKSMKTK